MSKCFYTILTGAGWQIAGRYDHIQKAPPGGGALNQFEIEFIKPLYL